MGRTMETTYEGYKNRETWCVALHIDNDQELTNTTRCDYDNAVTLAELGHDVWTREEHIRFTLAGNLEYRFSDLRPELNSLLHNDLLQTALGRVDWQELADHFIEKYTA